MIQIANDASGLMHLPNSTCNVKCGTNNESVINLREVALTGFRTVQFMQRAVSRHKPHDKAKKVATTIRHHLARIGN